MKTKLLLLLLATILVGFFADRSNAAAQLHVTVATDNQTYGPGQLVSVHGQVLDENLKGVAFAGVSIQANDPSGKPIHAALVFSSADGNYADEFTAPSSAVNGGYTIYVTASKPGYVDANGQATCTITPEFPISHTPWLILLPAVLVVLFAKRRRR